MASIVGIFCAANFGLRTLMSANRRNLLGTFGAAIVAMFAPRDPEAAEREAQLARAREQMVAEIAAMARETRVETGRAEFAANVLNAMRKVERHRFVSAEQAASAYRNHPLPIGRGQTISQPYIVALTTDLVEPRKSHRVLEIGTGSGYQAAVLAEIVDKVYSVEIVEALGLDARSRLHALGYRNVEVRIGDGHAGWSEHAPYDSIVVTAAATHMPPALVAQLKPGGRMVIPIGPQASGQDFVLVQKSADGSISQRVVLPVRFVPMTSGAPR
jgi:protein-L-isoaspartate(D-aspartate) O-methyltransferase